MKECSGSEYTEADAKEMAKKAAEWLQSEEGKKALSELMVTCVENKKLMERLRRIKWRDLWEPMTL